MPLKAVRDLPEQVHGVVVDCFQTTGACPTMAEVAAVLGTYEVAVLRAVRRLEARGLLRRVRLGGPEQRARLALPPAHIQVAYVGPQEEPCPATA